MVNESAMTADRRRLEPDARRAQLVEAGLALLKAGPFEEVGPAEVAKAVGVSKALVFHYFASNRHLQVAIAQAAAQELVAELATDPRLPNDERLAIGLERFIDYIERQPDTYVAVARGAGANQQLLEVYEECRREIVQLIAEAVGQPDPSPMLRIGLRGWIAGVEEAALQWLDGKPIPRSDLVDLLRRAGLSMLEALPQRDQYP